MPRNQNHVVRSYRRTASGYDASVRFFNLFARFGFDIPAWRETAVNALDLLPGDTVVDIGCGTGLNFPLLQTAVGAEGKIIGVDLSGEMLQKAKERVSNHRWENIDLVHVDATQFEFPPNLGGVLSTFALILIPGCREVIANGTGALVPGRRLVVLDMAWPESLPTWWRRVLFFLRFYGLTGEMVAQRPWDTIWNTMKDHLTDLSRKKMWWGFFYLAVGVRG